MSITVALLLAAAVWLATGLVLSVAMGRRGHDPFVWWLLGTLLGPLALALAIPQARRRPSQRTRVVRPAADHGLVDVLIGLDGSAHAEAALQSALELLGGRLGRVTLATVMPLDDSPQQRLDRSAAMERLERAGARVAMAGSADHPRGAPELVLLSGRPADELERRAIEDGYGLLVVGARGAGLSKTLLGSTATELAARGRVPVLVAGGAPGPLARGRSGSPGLAETSGEA